MDATVRTVLEEAFPDRSVDRITATGGSWNGANETVAVDDGTRAFCKVSRGDAGRIARERAVLRYVSETRPIAVPPVLAADADAADPYLVTAPVPGRRLDGIWPDDDARSNLACAESLFRRVGRTLATLHGERFESAGEIRGLASAADLDLDPAPWPDVLHATVERTREIGTCERLADHYDAVHDCIEANRGRLAGAPAALLHGDVAGPNLFVTEPGTDEGGPDGIAAIDWELAHVGDPARDLVRATDQLCNGFDGEGPDRLESALYEGYRARADGLPRGFERRRPVYRVVRVLGRSGFLDQWATHLDTSVEALADRADAELRARLDAV
ncbi:phosphotransferase [Halorubrum sp. CBA1125]|uniref:phosphotransferase family protein n=1 Tax=Halorubrum sp. CBA1125 TaxID=2668072 RepID=UPI0012E7275F|nr:aminoglycoside phosphotransferase family protein [Halorubrum sp. CBA1125]MUW15526.1 phosphotransferase [Halorubrum sp. CBA1125]